MVFLVGREDENDVVDCCAKGRLDVLGGSYAFVDLMVGGTHFQPREDFGIPGFAEWPTGGSPNSDVRGRGVGDVMLTSTVIVFASILLLLLFPMVCSLVS